MNSPKIEEKCEWYQSDDFWDDGVWLTSCKQEFVLNDGPPSENGMKYCFHCGKVLVEGKIK